MKKLSLLGLGLGMLASLGVTAGEAAAQSTLDIVKQRGVLRCQVGTPAPGFYQLDEQGNWYGSDVAICRAIAAAIFDDPSKVEFQSVTSAVRFTAMANGESDVLSRTTTWTLFRDTQLGLDFTAVNFYDGQGFMVSRDLGITSAAELDGAAICIQSGTTTELNLADYFRANGMEFDPIVFDTSEQTVGGFQAGRCDVLTSDTSQLAALRIQLDDPSGAMILPDVISKEPLGPVVRQGDDLWFNIVKWSLFAMINGEEYGVTSENAEEMLSSDNPDVARLLGQDGNYGEGMGLDADWAYNILSQVGNYGESFERNVGMGSPLEIERGVNALWNQGGFQYAPPIR